MDHPSNSGGEERLRGAVRRIAVDPDLRARVRARMRPARRPPTLLRPTLGLVCALLPALALWVMREADSGRVDLRQFAADQHAACAVAGIARVRPLEPRDQPVARRLAAAVPAGCRLLDVHRCRMSGRWYLHAVLDHGETRVSLLMADLKPGETQARQWAVAVPRGRYRVSALSGGGRALFLVSDLLMADHDALARQLDPDTLLPRERARLRAPTFCLIAGRLTDEPGEGDILLCRMMPWTPIWRAAFSPPTEFN